MSLVLPMLLALVVPTADAGRSRPSGSTTADVDVSVNLPTFDVGAAHTVSIVVSNGGRATAENVVVDIFLPETHTSPTTYLLGNVTISDSRCVVRGADITCNLGRMKSNTSASVSFDLSLPWSAAPLAIDAAVSTTTTESSTSNNTDGDDAVVVYPDLAVSGPQLVENQHCTGQNLTAFYECTLFPSSISQHDTVLNADGSITFPGYPDYSGQWWQNADDQLDFVYTELGVVVAEFSGNAVDGSCFEGLTTFPTSPLYVAPYAVCLR